MVSIEQIICSYFIKYERLYEMIRSCFAGSNQYILNIYIDLYSILKPIYTMDCTIDDYNIVSSCIINMCAHYREFFARAPFNVKTNFFIVHSYNINEVNNQFYKDYNILMKNNIKNDPRKTDMINYNLGILELICPYLPNIYFINGTFETGVIINDLIQRYGVKNPQVPSVIITKDSYNYQLVNINNNICVFRPKKNKDGDVSYYVNKLNLLNIYMLENKIKYVPERVFPEMYSLLLALSHCKERGIKMEMNITQAYKTILGMIDQYIITGMHTLMDNTLETNINNYISMNTARYIPNLKSRYTAIDIQQQLLIYQQSPSYTTATKGLVDLKNPEAVKEINNKYFIKHPLDLNRL